MRASPLGETKALIKEALEGELGPFPLMGDTI